MSMSVCLSVTVCPLAYSESPNLNLTKFSTHFPCGRGVVCRRAIGLCGFVGATLVAN